MIQLREIIRSDVVGVPGVTLRGLIEFLAEHGVSGARRTIPSGRAARMKRICARISSPRAGRRRPRTRCSASAAPIRRNAMPSTAPVKEAAKQMVKHSIHRVLVIDDGALAGIVTTSDIVRAVAQGKL